MCRGYDPNLQRWLNRDPAEESGGLNLYDYVANCPVNLTDSDGRQIAPIYPPSFSPKLPPYPGFGNCYNYACNRPPGPGIPANMYPGERAGLPDLGFRKGWNCASIASRVKGDYPGDGNVGAPIGGSCAAGYHKIRPEVTPDGIGFHFKRQDPDGSWSEKLGDGPAPPPTICNPNKLGYPPVTPGGPPDKQCPDICVPN
jgi:hypothetical protein